MNTTLIGNISSIPVVANLASFPLGTPAGTLRWVTSENTVYVHTGSESWQRLSSDFTQDAKQAADYATAAALPAVTYANGTSGVGATLTADANGALSVDGASPTVGQRILVKDQAATLQNGIYEVTATGDGSNPFVLTRTTDFDSSDEVDGGEFVYVRAGSTLAQTGWQQTAVSPTIGTNPIVWAQISGGGGGTAATTSYDNTASSLVATNVQDAIDEVEGRVDTLETATVTLQDAYDDSGTIELFPTFFAKTLEADTNSLVFLATQNPAFPIGQFVFTTPPATGGANTQILSVVNQSTINAAMSVSNEAGSASSNLFYVGNSGTISSAHSIFQNTSTGSSSGILAAQNAGTVADYISLIQAADGSTNSGQAFLVIQNLDTASGNDIPLIRLNHLAGTATGAAVDIQFTLRTADPTNLVDGGLWFNTTDNQLKFSDGSATYPLAHLEDGTDRGSLNLPVLSADPISPQDGDVWLFDDSATRAIRARMGGVTYSVTLT